MRTAPPWQCGECKEKLLCMTVACRCAVDFEQFNFVGKEGPGMCQLTNVAVFFGMYLGLAHGESRQKRSRTSIGEIKNRRTSLHKG